MYGTYETDLFCLWLIRLYFLCESSQMYLLKLKLITNIGKITGTMHTSADNQLRRRKHSFAAYCKCYPVHHASFKDIGTDFTNGKNTVDI